ncbi:NAD(P)/FAD-dependent oxidoreductase [Myxococcota bacterium]|nr:NAD(P)/FAD-dependent oxidoreductase [Myxococcota bacterium]
MSDAERFDAIVIGSGLGGLTAGALAAKAGRRVLVLERHTLLGGAATVFPRKDLLVEVALHALDGLDPQDFKRGIFKELGVFDALKFSRLPELYAAHHPSLGATPMVVPEGVDEARAAFSLRFPTHQAAIARWFDLLEAIRDRVLFLDAHRDDRLFWALNAPRLPFKLWPLIRYGKATVGEVLNRLFGRDEAVKLALVANLQYYADKLDLSLPFFALAQTSFYRGGHYIRGGSQALSSHLAAVIREGGGLTLTGREVTDILVEEGRFAGVIHRDKRGKKAAEARAPLCFGNAAPTVLGEMLPEPTRQAFQRRYGAMKLSSSVWAIYLGLTRSPVELGVAHYSSFIFPDWMRGLEDIPTAKGLLASAPSGRVPNYAMVNYERLKKPGLARKGRSLMVLGGLDALAHWEDLEPEAYKAKKAAWQAAIIADLLQRFPRLEPHLVYQEMATAKTVKRYLNTPGGAISGFDQIPSQAGGRRAGARTPLPGLYLASAFAQPGGGFTGAILAGQNAFRAAK